MHHLRILPIILIAALTTDGLAQVLYDGPAGTAPDAQPWLAYYSLPGLGVKSTAGGKTTYDSTALGAEQGGFSNHTLLGSLKNAAFPALDRTTGYTLSFNLKLLSETHDNNNRAGVSLIALSSDLQGIELGFWSNEIWAQSGSGFTHAEGIAFDTTASNTTYDLTVSGTNYSLMANSLPILNGSLRDYSAAGLVYTLPNFLFLGDDTTSAKGSFEVSQIVLVPEPVTGATLAILIGLLGARRRWR